jgi:HAE1 family hydrophobic/amphiphilic exporter-1
LVIVVVFLPIAMSTGLVSNIITQCVVVVIATLLSLLSSFTLIPWLSSRFGKLEHITGKNIFGKIILGFEKLDSFTHWVTGILKWALKSRGTKIASLLVAIGLFFGAIFITGKYVGGEFFAKLDRGQFMVQIELPKDASLESTNLMLLKAEDFLKEKRG